MHYSSGKIVRNVKTTDQKRRKALPSIEEQGGECSKRLFLKISRDGEHFFCKFSEIRNWPRIELEGRGFMIVILGVGC